MAAGISGARRTCLAKTSGGGWLGGLLRVYGVVADGWGAAYPWVSSYCYSVDAPSTTSFRLFGDCVEETVERGRGEGNNELSRVFIHMWVWCVVAHLAMGVGGVCVDPNRSTVPYRNVPTSFRSFANWTIRL